MVSDCRSRTGSVRRTASSGNGRAAVRDRSSPPTGATRAPTCSAPSARLAAWPQHSRFPSPTPMPCSVISTRSLSMSPETLTPRCYSTAPDGTPLPIWSGRRTSPRSCCRRARRNSLRSSRSGNISAPTTFQTASLTTTTPLSTPHAKLGEISPISRYK